MVRNWVRTSSRTGGPVSEASSVRLRQPKMSIATPSSALGCTQAEWTKLSSSAVAGQSEIGPHHRYLLQDETTSATRRPLLQNPGVALPLLIRRFASAADGV